MKSDIITWPKDTNGNWTEDKYCREPEHVFWRHLPALHTQWRAARLHQ
jgi:hypothetical protein